MSPLLDLKFLLTAPEMSPQLKNSLELLGFLIMFNLEDPARVLNPANVFISEKLIIEI